MSRWGQALRPQVAGCLPGLVNRFDPEPFCPLPGVPGSAHLIGQRRIQHGHDRDVARLVSADAKVQREQVPNHGLGLIQPTRPASLDPPLHGMLFLSVKRSASRPITRHLGPRSNG
jgi:hypothetical protein